MRFLVLGGGLQGRAAICDLLHSDAPREVICADADPAAVRAAFEKVGRGVPESKSFEVVAYDARDRAALDELLRTRFDAVVDMLPRQFARGSCEAAIAHRTPLVNTFYCRDLADLHQPAAAAGVALLPEMGFDPGIDLILYARVRAAFDTVESLRSYGGGFPEPAAADNPFQYKISWTWEGVLNSYDRRARLVRNGRTIEIEPARIFDEHHRLEVDPVGELEAFANGDIVPYLELLGIAGTVTDAGRYTLRWPGHCELWGQLVELGLLEQTPVPGLDLTPRQFMVKHFEPRLKYADDERDIVVLRVAATGLRGGERKRVVIDLVDYRCLETGFLAMNRCVGYPASIAAQMIATGQIDGRGLLSPARDVPPEPFLALLQERGVTVTEEVVAM